MLITALYAGLLAFIYIVLTGRIVMMRYTKKIQFGHGNDSALQLAIRAHGNFIEYVPFALLLLFLLAQIVSVLWVCHAMGFMLVAGRIMHIIALTGPFKGNVRLALRAAGMTLTLLMMAICAVHLLWWYAIQ